MSQKTREKKSNRKIYNVLKRVYFFGIYKVLMRDLNFIVNSLFECYKEFLILYQTFVYKKFGVAH